ncbi:MAG: 30S ribosomal protein S18 [Deltaproteobacteria bacterium]|jgi:small subunit ribosomal protein S18|nr:30S ribosomal protein S18 [Deltaproteobacteria bacterium]MBT4525121.1 30S ribosomal protein S18 [Deltaproteobacteria bacterium]
MGKKKRRSPNTEGIQKRPCAILHSGIEEVNYKDVELLKLFVTEKGKIIPRRISGLSAKSQKKLTAAVKRARNSALLSFSEGYVPQDEPMEKGKKS